MRRIISITEPSDITVLWAKPSVDGSYFIEQIFGPNGWELFGEGSGGGGTGGLETDPIWNAEKSQYATDAELALQKTTRDTQINGIINNMNTIDSNVDAVSNNVTTINSNLQSVSNVVNQNQTDIIDLQNQLNNLSIPGSLIWQSDTIATQTDLPSDLTSAEVGYIYQVQDTGALYLWNGSTYIKMNGITDLSNYLTSTQVNSLLANKRDTLSASMNVYVTDGTGNQSAIPYSTAATANTIPVRSTNGSIGVPTNVQGNNAVGYLQVAGMIDNIPIAVPDEVFDYTGSNTFTLSQIPKFVSQVWIDGTNSLTLVRVSNVSISGGNVTINNQKFESGDLIRVHYFV